jgi:hypothetical protein
MPMPADTEVKTSGSRESLRDLEVVGLEVERLPSSLKDEGVNEQDILSFIRERLEKAPVNVISRTGAEHRRGSPRLSLEVSLFEREPGSFMYTVTLELIQGVGLERSDHHRFVPAPTWRAEAVGLAQKGQLAALKGQMGATADAFVTDFAAK